MSSHPPLPDGVLYANFHFLSLKKKTKKPCLLLQSSEPAKPGTNAALGTCMSMSSFILLQNKKLF